MAGLLASLTAGLARYLDSEEHSDCTIICGPYQFKLHKVIIGAHSEYFRTAFKAKAFQEGETGTIHLKAKGSESEDIHDVDDYDCDDPEIVKLMVRYFYHLEYLEDYDETPPKGSTNLKMKSEKVARSSLPSTKSESDHVKKVHLIEHVKVLAIAMKYQVDALQTLAFDRFEADCQRYWNNKDFAQACELAYSAVLEDAPQVRKVVADVLHNHRSHLFHKPDIQSLLRETPGIAFDLLVRDQDIEVVICGCRDQELFKHFCQDCKVEIMACAWCTGEGALFYCKLCNDKPFPS